ncbi:MAG: ABC transporter ATP-binding protein [Chloroflexi bacterium]|nr:ABC transporter ATP-binding protein [Chloroflexota bacterium]
MLTLTDITKTYDHAPLLRAISLTIDAGEIVSLLGPSGGGKTTLLRIVAGLEQPERGEIIFDGRNLREVPTHQRGIGMMFQDLALFPHRNVFENVAFGLQMHAARVSRDAIRARVNATLELVGLAGFAERDVNNLSGGEQQRVALARALAPQPKLLMFDEPLGALDRLLREQLVAEVRAILKRIGMTALYVTHDQDEAFAIADRVAILHAGQIAQIGTPEEIYRAPADTFVARFLGLTNLFAARVRADGAVETELGTFVIARSDFGDEAISDLRLGDCFAASRLAMTSALIRPERVRVGESGIAARVDACTFRAGKYRVSAATERGARLIVETDRAFAIGATIHLQIKAVELVRGEYIKRQ